MTDTITLLTPVLIVEDEPFVQARLKIILQDLGYPSSELFFADNLAVAHELKQQHDFQLALIDLGLPDGHGSTFIEALNIAQPEVSILVISAWSTQTDILKALKAGATGYLLKERDDMEVAFAIRSVLRGGAPIDPFIARQILMGTEILTQPTTKNTQSTIAFSQREKEILELVAKGMSNKEVANVIHLSRYTVEGHIKNVYRKLSVSTRTQAINVARDLGLLD